jgi:hypothetical protein
MLGSSFDGERANAARMIAAMAEKNRVTIVELIYGSSAPRRETLRREPPRSKPSQSNSRTMLDALAGIAANAEELEFVLTAWECNFANDVSSKYAYDYELSEKQIAIVESILRKVDASGWTVPE